MSARSALAVFLIISFVVTSAQQTTEAVEVMCNRTMDLVFVMDGSNSLGEERFKNMTETLARAVEVLDFGVDSVRVGAVLYSRVVSAVVELKTNISEFQEAVLQFEYPDDSTNTDLGIYRAVAILTSYGRKGVPLVITIVTDGSSSEPVETFNAAESAKMQGIDMWVIGVGELKDIVEMAKIATNGKTQTFGIETFEEFPDQLLNLTRLVCESAVTRSTYTLPTSTTTSSPATSTTREPSTVDNPYTELCKNSPSIGGVGHALYPGDCTKVLQCYYNPYTKKTLVVTRQCPSGQFWDQTCLKCAPSWTVDCPYDKCKQTNCSSCASGPDMYPMDGVCGGFWSCSKGRSYPKCCPPCYSYMPGFGCKFGTTCYDKCGAEEECAVGLGVCEKIPVWENETNYALVTDQLGMSRTTCSRADFNIIQCRCELRLMDIFMQNGAECTPYYESSSSVTCTAPGNSQAITIKQNSNIGTFQLSVRITVATPSFQISSTPSSCAQCDNSSAIRIWSDDAGIHASLGDPASGGTEVAVMLKNPTGELEILVILYKGVLTLAVRRGEFQVVSAVKARSQKLCTECLHNLTATSNSPQSCVINKVQLYDCKTAVSNIYKVD